MRDGTYVFIDSFLSVFLPYRSGILVGKVIVSSSPLFLSPPFFFLSVYQPKEHSNRVNSVPLPCFISRLSVFRPPLLWFWFGFGFGFDDAFAVREGRKACL